MGSHWVLILLYLKNVPYWPEDDRLRSKHVAIMWPECIYNITVLIYCCVLTEYNTLYKVTFLYFPKHITLRPGPQNVSSQIIILVIKDPTLSGRNLILLFEENMIFPCTWYCMQIIQIVVWCYTAAHLSTLVQGLKLQGCGGRWGGI